MQWLLVLGSFRFTTVGDLLQSFEMKRHKRASIGQTLGFLQPPAPAAEHPLHGVSFFSFLALLRMSESEFRGSGDCGDRGG